MHREGLSRAYAPPLEVSQTPDDQHDGTFSASTFVISPTRGREGAAPGELAAGLARHCAILIGFEAPAPRGALANSSIDGVKDVGFMPSKEKYGDVTPPLLYETALLFLLPLLRSRTIGAGQLSSR